MALSAIAKETTKVRLEGERDHWPFEADETQDG